MRSIAFVSSATNGNELDRSVKQHPFASQWHARITQQTSTSHCNQTVFTLILQLKSGRLQPALFALS